nr:GerMN domain-containing protein [uncultured Peptostreptococcus sp.]
MMINKKIKLAILSTSLVLACVFSTACQDKSNVSKKSPDQASQDSANKEDSTMTSQDDMSKSDSKTDTDNLNSSDKKNNQKQNNIIYYTFDINTEKLTENTKSVDVISVGNIVKAMIDSKILPEGTEVKSAKVTDIGGTRTIIVDMNEKFINFNQGSTSESLTLRAFANSLIKTFKVKQVKLSVDGENYSGGHIALKDGEYLKYK